MIVTREDICKLIEKLKCGKASGPDGISAESLRFAHDSLHCIDVFQLASHIVFCHSPYLKLPLYLSLKISVAA